MCGSSLMYATTGPDFGVVPLLLFLLLAPGPLVGLGVLLAIGFA